MIALGKEVIEELIMNLKDAGCDEELIKKKKKKYKVPKEHKNKG